MVVSGGLGATRSQKSWRLLDDARTSRMRRCSSGVVGAAAADLAQRREVGCRTWVVHQRYHRSWHPSDTFARDGRHRDRGA
jgi:hypothetical protein